MAAPGAEFSATEREALTPSSNTGARLAGGVPPPPPPPVDGVLTLMLEAPPTFVSLRSLSLNVPENL
jgi:hypothetical protein